MPDVHEHGFVRLPGGTPVAGAYAYIVAVGLVAIFIGLRLLLPLGEGAPRLLILMVVPIMITAYIGGAGPGLTATILAALGAAFLVIPPRFSLHIENPNDLLSAGILLAVGAIASMGAEMLHRARSRATGAAIWQGRAADVLREQERNLRTLVENAPVGLALFDKDMVCLAASRRWSDDFGRNRPDFIGRRLYEVYPELPPRWHEIHARGLAGHAQSADDDPLDLGDGTRIWLRWTVAPWYETDEAIGGIVIFAEDVTARRQMEEARHESETTFRTLLESLSDGVFVAQDHRFAYANPALAQMLGYTVEEFAGTPFEKVVAPEFFAVWSDRYERRIGTGPEPTRNYELRFLHKDGVESSWVELRASRARFMGRPAVLGVVRDTTVRRAVEQEVRNSQRRLQTALDAGGMGIWIWDVARDSVWWDEASTRIWGRAIGSHASADTVWGFVHPDDRAAVAASRTELTKGGGASHMEFRILLPDGAVRWLSSQATVERADDGTALRVVGICQDVTAARYAEEQLLRSQKLEALGTLAGGIAHDFNNLLLAINGNARLAAEDLPAGHPARQSVDEIARAGVRAVDVVRRILSYSRQEELPRTTIALEPVVREALQLVRVSVPPLIGLHGEFADDVPPVNASPSQIHQIVMNLLTNAAHAIGARAGRIDVRLTRVELGSAQAAALSADLRPGAYACVTVSDDGGGIPADIISRIFDPFFTTKSVGEGTGLGLSVVHGLVRAHGGAVNVSSEPGTGTVFRLYFPAAEAVVAASAPAPAAGPDTRRARLLYVDDEDALVFLGTRVLRRMGYEVSGHTDAEEALREFERTPDRFDVVVTDLAMPRMSGFDLAARLLERRPGLPVVLMSGYVRVEDQQAAARAGVREILLKPNTIEELGVVLDRVLREVRKS